MLLVSWDLLSGSMNRLLSRWKGQNLRICWWLIDFTLSFIIEMFNLPLAATQAQMMIGWSISLLKRERGDLSWNLSSFYLLTCGNVFFWTVVHCTYLQHVSIFSKTKNTFIIYIWAKRAWVSVYQLIYIHPWLRTLGGDVRERMRTEIRVAEEWVPSLWL